jgi:hypothetical protein
VLNRELLHDTTGRSRAEKLEKLGSIESKPGPLVFEKLGFLAQIPVVIGEVGAKAPAVLTMTASTRQKVLNHTPKDKAPYLTAKNASCISYGDLE